MNRSTEMAIKEILLVLIWVIWGWGITAKISGLVDACIIIGGLLLVFPLIWLARKWLDRDPAPQRVTWITVFVHYALGVLFGLPIIRAIITQAAWSGWVLPLSPWIGQALTVMSGLAFLLVVANLALKGLGAPFAIALSQKLAVDWMYAWTRNPMVLAGIALLVSLGLWYRSALFVLWALALFTPALLYFLKVYEERELELRFGASYLEYRSRTPFLWPKKPV